MADKDSKSDLSQTVKRVARSYNEWVNANCLLHCKEQVADSLRAFAPLWAATARQEWRFRDVRFRHLRTFTERDRQEHRKILARLYRLRRRGFPEVARDAAHVLTDEPEEDAKYAYRAWLRAVERERSRDAKKEHPKFRKLLQLATIVQRHQWQQFDAALRSPELGTVAPGFKRCPECDEVTESAVEGCECRYDFGDAARAQEFLEYRAELQKPEVQSEVIRRTPDAVNFLRMIGVDVYGGSATENNGVEKPN